MSAPKLLKPPVSQRTKLVVKREAVRLEFSIQAIRREAGQIRWICKSGGGDIISDERGDHGTFSLSTRVFHTCGWCANVRVEDVNGMSKPFDLRGIMSLKLMAKDWCRWMFVFAVVVAIRRRLLSSHQLDCSPGSYTHMRTIRRELLCVYVCIVCRDCTC